MADLADLISKAEASELDGLLKCVLNRYSVLFPDWEVCTFSVEKNQDRRKQFDDLIAHLESMKKTLP